MAARAVRRLVPAFVMLFGLAACGGGGGNDPFALCGNGRLDAGEQCDSGSPNDDRGDCLSTCVAAVCSDGFVDSTGARKEDCDGNNLNGATCNTLGLADIQQSITAVTALRCTADCHFDASGCGVMLTPTPLIPTPTPTPPLCGNGHCDVGDAESPDTCPADCAIQACTPAGSRTRFVVNLGPPGVSVQDQLTVTLAYPSGRVSIPGSGSDSSVSGRVGNKPPGVLLPLVVNDLDYALQVTVKAATISAGRLFTVDFDNCAGATTPPTSDFACACTPIGASTCTCAVTKTQ